MSVGSQRKTKERVLKEVTNKLEAGPVKFKPIRNGPRINNGSATRDGGSSEKKITNAGARGVENGPRRGVTSNLRTGPYSPHPPDPIQGG